MSIKKKFREMWVIAPKMVALQVGNRLMIVSYNSLWHEWEISAVVPVNYTGNRVVPSWDTWETLQAWCNENLAPTTSDLVNLVGLDGCENDVERVREVSYLIESESAEKFWRFCLEWQADIFTHLDGYLDFGESMWSMLNGSPSVIIRAMAETAVYNNLLQGA